MAPAPGERGTGTPQRTPLPVPAAPGAGRLPFWTTEARRASDAAWHRDDAELLVLLDETRDELQPAGRRGGRGRRPARTPPGSGPADLAAQPPGPCTRSPAGHPARGARAVSGGGHEERWQAWCERLEALALPLSRSRTTTASGWHCAAGRCCNGIGSMRRGAADGAADGGDGGARWCR